MSSNSKPNLSSLTAEKREKLKESIRKIDDSLTRIIGERDFIKETIETSENETGLDKKLIRKLAKTMHKASYSMEKEENETFDELYDLLYKQG